MPFPSGHRTVVAALQGVALVLLGLHAAHTGLGLGAGSAVFDTWLYHALMVGAALALVARGVLVGEDRTAWIVLGAGALAWSAGDLYFTAFLADDADPPTPSVSDALFLAFYPATWIGLGLLVKRHVSEFPLSLRIDAVMGALAVGALTVTLLHDTIAIDLTGDVGPIVTTLAYPVGDVLVLSLVTALLALTGWRPGATWALIGGALVLGAAGDAAFLLQSARGTYADGTLLDSVWPASLLLLALAAWRRPRYTTIPLEGLRILAMPAVFVTIAMGIFVAGQFEPLSPIALGLACGTIIALVVRMGVTLAENHRIVAASRGEALTDSLTGLGNRRALMADLEREIARASASDPRALVLFDLDGFKAYNDGFGHLAGDAILARLGARLAAAAEPTGTAYRLGGDEFCVLLRGRSAASADLHATLADALHEPGDEHALRSSFGGVVMPAEARTVALALHLADERMYANKDRAKRPASSGTSGTGSPGRRSLLGVAVGAVLVLAALPAIAAAEVAEVRSGVLSYDSGVAEANVVTTRELAASWAIVDWGSPVPRAGSGCKLSLLEVQCAKAGVTRIALATRDRDDTVTHVLPVPASIAAGAGADRLTGGPSDDTLEGGLGADVLDGGAGADHLDAGPGDDTIRARDGATDTIDCGEGSDIVEADPADALVGCANDLVRRATAPGPAAQTSALAGAATPETGVPGDATPLAVERPAAAPVGSAPPGAGVVERVVRVSGGAATLELTCPASELRGCRGDAYVDPAPVPATAGAKGRTARQRASLARGRFGRSRFVLAAGRAGEVKVRLSGAARQALGLTGRGKAKAARRGRRVKAVVTVVQRGRRAHGSRVDLRG